MEKLGLEPSEELMSSQDNSFLSPPAVSRDCAGPALRTGSGRLCRHQRWRWIRLCGILLLSLCS